MTELQSLKFLINLYFESKGFEEEDYSLKTNGTKNPPVVTFTHSGSKKVTPEILEMMEKAGIKVNQ